MPIGYQDPSLGKVETKFEYIENKFKNSNWLVDTADWSKMNYKGKPVESDGHTWYEVNGDPEIICGHEPFRAGDNPRTWGYSITADWRIKHYEKLGFKITLKGKVGCDKRGSYYEVNMPAYRSNKKGRCGSDERGSYYEVDVPVNDNGTIFIG